ncbi:MAG: ribosome biogenesis GTP-binding protein YihA/YsxC [Cyclobacteriaceae bacterium]|nr:ribosome biogenesis GTP-binding protein YihA/YsxC [Cyclobacteriaceae bacterium]
MEIKESEFISSITNLKDLPKKPLPEFAFIGRSNVGKSSLINMLADRRQLAKISVKPGKTQTINHYLMNKSWYLVDLPGYGYAGVSKEKRAGFGQIIENYVKNSPQLCCLFVLLDVRLPLQAIDLDFINWAGSQNIPLAFVYTKADKLSAGAALAGRKRIEAALLKHWQELPDGFITSSVKKKGREELLHFIDSVLKSIS